MLPCRRPDVCSAEQIVWRSPEGKVIACVEKNKVLQENLVEIRQVCQDALEDAILMGCDEQQFLAVCWPSWSHSLKTPIRPANSAFRIFPVADKTCDNPCHLLFEQHPVGSTL